MVNLKIMALEDKCNKQYETIVKLQDEKIDLFKENQQLKEVINEVREISNDLYNIIYNYKYEKFGLSREQYENKFKKLLQILDKAGDDNE